MTPIQEQSLLFWSSSFPASATHRASNRKRRITINEFISISLSRPLFFTHTRSLGGGSGGGVSIRRMYVAYICIISSFRYDRRHHYRRA